MIYLDVWSVLLLFFHYLHLSSAASLIAHPLIPPGVSASEFLGPDLQSNYTIPPFLLSSNLTAERPNSYQVPHAAPPTSIRIAWLFGDLPQKQFDKFIFYALNIIVTIVIDEPKGNSPIKGDMITFRSQSIHIRATSESRYSLKYGTLANALRGIGEVMSTFGPTQAEVYIVENRDQVGRISIEYNRGG